MRGIAARLRSQGAMAAAEASTELQHLHRVCDKQWDSPFLLPVLLAKETGQIRYVWETGE